jgi:hypothetical protein
MEKIVLSSRKENSNPFLLVISITILNVFALASCKNLFQTSGEKIVNQIINLKEYNNIADLKFFLWDIDHRTLQEPFRSIVLLEKKWYFLDTSNFNPQFTALDKLIEAKRLAYEEDYKNGTIAFLDYFNQDSLIISNTELANYVLPFVYEAKLRIKVDANLFSDYYNVAESSNSKYYNFYKTLFIIEDEIDQSEFELAKIHSQALVSEILNYNKRYCHLLSYASYKVYWSKLNNADLQHLDIYRNCIPRNLRPSYINSLFELAEFTG